MFGHTSRKRPTTFTRLPSIRQTIRYLARVKLLTRSGMLHPFLRCLSFLLMDSIVPLVCVTESCVRDLEIDQKIMKYDERHKMATLSLLNYHVHHA
jgi:hypothetical protein